MALQARFLDGRLAREQHDPHPLELSIAEAEQRRCVALGFPLAAFALLAAVSAAGGGEWARSIEGLFPFPGKSEVGDLPSFDEGIDEPSSVAIAVLLYSSLQGRVSWHLSPDCAAPGDPVSRLHLRCIAHLSAPNLKPTNSLHASTGTLLDELSASVSFHRLLRGEPGGTPGYDRATYAHVVDFLSGSARDWLARCVVTGHSPSVEQAHLWGALANRFRALQVLGDREEVERLAQRLVESEVPACVYEAAAWRARNGATSQMLCDAVSRALATATGGVADGWRESERTCAGKLVTCLALLLRLRGETTRARAVLAAALECADFSARDRGVIAWRLAQLQLDVDERHEAEAVLDAYACELGGLGLLIRLRHDRLGPKHAELLERLGRRWRHALDNELARPQRDLVPSVILAGRNAGDWSVARAIALLSADPAPLAFVDALSPPSRAHDRGTLGSGLTLT